MKRRDILVALAATPVMSSLAGIASAEPQNANLALLHAFLAAIRKAAFEDKAPAEVRRVAEQYLTTDYLQHADGAPAGREGYIAMMIETGKHIPPGPLPFEDVYFMADEGRVVWMSKGARPDPAIPGQVKVGFSFNMLRVENGKFAEHWAG